jgi:5-oxoprolinase (ATP-hydrolysing)
VTDAERPAAATGTSPIELELFSHRFASIVRDMGEVLRRTALSVNVKERLDFSCALLDSAGYLVVNAPHIPVHLGAIGLCVRGVAKRCDVAPGDVLVTNHPAVGGSHLPDVTVITPVFALREQKEPLAWVASRAHHAEIGGSRPGSMPPDARTLGEEGVVLPPHHLVRRGEARWEAMRERLSSGRFPSRAVEENLADLAAAVAANHRGATALSRLVGEHGAKTVQSFMTALREHAAQQIRGVFASWKDGRRAAEQRLDDGSVLRVSFEISGDRARVDFTGSSAVHPGNLNATPAIVTSAVLYVLRLLVEQPIPLNEGLLDPVELVIPEGILNPPFPGDPFAAPAVVGGNVETSQRLVDTLLQALGVVACSQGTMNNVLFGNQRFSYYETVCGGCGAGPGFDGASGVHSHMTNTAMTDPEVLEYRYPVRLDTFRLRAGSGGAGRWRGGDGVVRELTFLEPVALSVVSQHRKVAPYGVAGGSDGRPGRQWVERVGGRREQLEPIDGRELEAGDRLVLETPGGGGWGDRPAAREKAS